MCYRLRADSALEITIFVQEVGAELTCPCLGAQKGFHLFMWQPEQSWPSAMLYPPQQCELNMYIWAFVLLQFWLLF